MNKKLWTPGGDVPVGEPGPSTPPTGAGAQEAASAGPRQAGAPGPGGPEQLTEEELRAQLEILAQVPVGGIVIEFASTLLTVAQLHLHPDELGEAKFAIDTLAAVVDAAGGRLGQAEAQLHEALRQVQMLFVQAAQAAGGEAASAGAPSEGDPEA